MTKPAVTFPDPERAVVDYLTTVAAGQFPAGTTIGVGVPAGWVPTSPTHIEVAWDGTPGLAWPVTADATIRVVVHAATTTLAKRDALLAQGLLCASGWPASLTIQPLTGVLPAQDPSTHAELASFTVRCRVRSVLIT